MLRWFPVIARRGQALAFGLTALLCGAIQTLGAEPPPHPPPEQKSDQPQGVGSREIWFGVDASARNWLVYSGGTHAPWDDIHGDGWRLRSTAGYGRYSYNFDASTRVNVEKSVADVLVGYQVRLGSLTAKGFVGGALLNTAFEVPSKSLRLGEQKFGFKTALELWLNLGPDAWTSLDLSYADTRALASARSRLGYRVLPTVSIGVEGVFNHTNLEGQIQMSQTTTTHGNARLGGFARYEWFGGEISASGGLAGDVVEARATGDLDLLHRPEVYGTLNLILQF